MSYGEKDLQVSFKVGISQILTNSQRILLAISHQGRTVKPTPKLGKVSRMKMNFSLSLRSGIFIKAIISQINQTAVKFELKAL